MATFFGSPPIFSLPHTRTHQISSSSQLPPPNPPPLPQQPSTSSPSQLSTKVNEEPLQVSTQSRQQKPIKPVTSSIKVDSTDWIATSLTRRFGLGAGLAWVGFLAFDVISEQVKTRLEVSQQEANTRYQQGTMLILNQLWETSSISAPAEIYDMKSVNNFEDKTYENVEKEEEVLLPNGIRYYELKVGGGASPRPGDLVVIDIMGKVEGTGEVFVDTFDRDKKPLALVMGSRPYSKGVCEGIEYLLRSMKAGGKRKVIVPPTLGFRDNGADLGTGVQIPPLATLEYIVEWSS